MKSYSLRRYGREIRALGQCIAQESKVRLLSEVHINFSILLFVFNKKKTIYKKEYKIYSLKLRALHLKPLVFCVHIPINSTSCLIIPLTYLQYVPAYVSPKQHSINSMNMKSKVTVI